MLRYPPMSLVDFIKNNYEISDSEQENLRKFEIETTNDFQYKNEYAIKKTPETYIQEITIQKGISEKSNRIMLGYKEAIKNLKELDTDEAVLMRFIENPCWDGRVFFSEKSNYLGLILGKKVNPEWKTPPNWDGSLEMLERFNNRPEIDD
jgi:hypothetical protein